MKLHNTLTRQTEELKPLIKGTISMYTCGLTVYSHPHIGNWVGYIYWDVLQRALEAEGYTVNRVQNITDVGHLVSDDDDGEDKMEKGARAEGTTAWQVADKYAAIAEHEAYELLGLKKPTLVRATDYIDQQIAFVQQLEQKGFTYLIPNEGVYFDTSKLNDYGKLARLDIDGLKDGARVALEGRKNPTDFAVWKLSPADAKRDMEWESPWGTGFPGWHLECSAIALHALGEQIDIHCGGIDHIPVHHTNEIAQTETLTGKSFANVWLHNNHLKVDGGKMAKSLGNIYTLQDITDKGFSLDAFKLMVLSKNYRTEGNFTWDILDSTQNRLTNWQVQTDLIWQRNQVDHNPTDELLQLLGNDIDTVQALALIDKHLDTAASQQLAPNKDFLESVENLLGINILGTDITSAQKDTLNQRQYARADKDWQKSDSLRDELAEQGVQVRDDSIGQLWSKTR